MPLILAAVLGLREQGACATYGIKTPDGVFSPKVEASIDEKEVTFRKIRPQDQFRSIALKLNKQNRSLANNVQLLQVIWIGESNRPGRPVPLAGPKYNPATMTFKDSMTKSVTLKIRDNSTQKLFVKKRIEDLMQLEIDDQPCISSEAFDQTNKVVTSRGQEVSISVDKTSILFNEENLSKSVMINIFNHSGRLQTVGIDPPDTGLLAYFGVNKQPAQTKIAPESWGRIPLDRDTGIFLTVIPEPDARKLARLNDKEIRVFVYEGAGQTPIRTIPIRIRVAAELRYGTEPGVLPRNNQDQEGEGIRPQGVQPRPVRPQAALTGVAVGGSWIWIFMILNLVLLIGTASYGIFFVMPRMQVLEDRLAKNEMFIHGSREAIREELEQTKKEILSRCLPPTEPEIE
ncbi:MAG: hypothetical protein AB1646_19535 [Thermodesulfobacteriota bacterium]